MGNREDALQILNELHSALPHPLFHSMDKAQKGKGFVLIHLARADGEVLAGDLAKEMGVSTARIATLLKTMEKDRLITRYNSSQDARRTIVEITPEGIECVKEMREHFLQNMETLLEKVGKDDLEEFIRLARKIKTAMSE